MKVPQEAWSGTKLNVAHLRTFGCIAFSHIPSELRKKLDDRSEKCILLATMRHPKSTDSTIRFQRNSFSEEMSNFLKISAGVSLKIALWTVKTHCCLFLNTQKIQDKKHISLSFQDCRYKDSLKVLRIDFLQAKIHLLKFKISELEA
jgi:hypothetical protein